MKQEDTQLPSNKKFGLFFSLVFGLLAFYFFDENITTMSLSFGLLCLTTISLVYIYPKFLTPLNRAWMKFGSLIGKFVSPVVLSFIFFIIISPVALIGKIFGRDELNLKLVDKETFWKKKDLENTKPSSFNNQF